MNKFTPKIDISSSDRFELWLSDTDIKKIKRGRTWKATVTSIVTGAVFKVAGCSCSCPACYCDAYVISIKGRLE
jgi:hypothetical protein